MLSAPAMSPRAIPCALFFLVGGCISVAHPSGFEERAGLALETVTATTGRMYGLSPISFESSVGRIEHELLELEVDDHLAGTYSEVSRITGATSGADLLCAHEPDGHAYPPGLHAAPTSVFACRGRIGSQHFTLDIDRGCRRGIVTIGAERWILDRGKITVAGAELPSGEATLRDERGKLVAALDLVATHRMRVWVRPEHRTAAILAAAAIHDWAERASAARVDACR